MDAELMSRQELVQELISRSTFTGLIVTTIDEIKESNDFEDFVLAARNISPENAIQILEETIRQLKEGLEEANEFDDEDNNDELWE
jgi:hypothetical protein